MCTGSISSAINHVLSVGPGKLKSDLRYMLSDDAGQARAGAIGQRRVERYVHIQPRRPCLWPGAAEDERRHFDAVPQRHRSPNLTNYIQINDFAEPGERSWQLRYDYDFAALGIPA